NKREKMKLIATTSVTTIAAGAGAVGAVLLSKKENREKILNNETMNSIKNNTKSFLERFKSKNPDAFSDQKMGAYVNEVSNEASNGPGGKSDDDGRHSDTSGNPEVKSVP